MHTSILAPGDGTRNKATCTQAQAKPRAICRRMRALVLIAPVIAPGILHVLVNRLSSSPGLLLVHLFPACPTVSSSRTPEECTSTSAMTVGHDITTHEGARPTSPCLVHIRSRWRACEGRGEGGGRARIRYLEDVGFSRDHAAHREARGRHANHEEEHDDRERDACAKLRQGLASE